MSARLERARILVETHRFADAEREAGMALAEEPDSAPAHALLAICLLQREDYAGATEHAEQAVGLAPNEPYMHFMLSGVWMARNYLDKAEAEIRIAVELDPFDADYHHRLGAIYAERKKWQPALESADQGLANDPEHTPSLNLRALALRNLGKKDDAQAQFDDALANDPDNAHTHANVGWTRLSMGQHKDAMRHFQEALRLDPELDSARAGIVESLKAHNPIYRPILRFFIWMGSLSTGNQWKFILGGYFGYLAARYVATNMPALRIIAIPLIVAYLAFVVVSWFAVPLSNLALRLHPVGRLALSRHDRIGSNWVGGSLLLAILSLAAWAINGWQGFREIAIFFGLITIPLAMTTMMRDRPRRLMWYYTAAVAACGVFVTWRDCVAPSEVESVAEAVGVQTFVGLLRIATFGFIVGSLLSVWAANVLASMSWKRN